MASFERIWAPWRASYVQKPDDDSSNPDPSPQAQRLEFLPGAEPDCFLCQAVAAHDDRGRYVIDRGQRTITLLNRYPYNNGHLLVAPQLHRAGLDELDAQTQLELFQTLARLVRILEKTLRAEGFNVGLNLGKIAGAGLPGHLHWHLVPRWGGDTNFMPALASVRVIPQSLDALWEALRLELGHSR